MQVKLRLQRFGTKKKPYYRIVAATTTKPRDGQFLEIVGLYHPVATKTDQYRIDQEKVNAWLAKGAQPTETVRDILRKAGLWKPFADAKEKAKHTRVLKTKAAKKAITTAS